MMIELRQLRYFLVAAKHGSFRKAGVALEVAESAVSRRVRDLEDTIGVSLFTRHSGGEGGNPSQGARALKKVNEKGLF